MNSTQVFEKRKIAVAIGIDLAKDHCDVVASQNLGPVGCITNRFLIS